MAGSLLAPAPGVAGADRFRVWPHAERPGYWCRRCGKQGDGIQYLRDRDGLNFAEACDRLSIPRMGQTLFDLLNGRNLRLYPAADLRQQALNTVSLETPRGWRIAKEKASQKIDAIVALAMACVAAVDAGNTVAVLREPRRDGGHLGPRGGRARLRR
jgi:hypothetical protein